MGLMRSVLRAGSQSVWLREHATRSPFVRRSVSRFMPGERLRLRKFALASGVLPGAYEFEMLYGIQRPLQARVVEGGARLRVLISYGDHWFPWYMRRLAERPANVLFVARSLIAG